MKAALVLAALALQGLQLRLESPQGPLIVRNAQHHTATVDGDIYRFKGTGEPVVIERPWQGFTASANTVDVQIQGLPGQNFLLRQGTFDGSAKIVSDTAAADAALKGAGKAPPSRSASERTEIVSDRFDYAGTAEDGALNSPGPLTTTDASHGVRQVRRQVDGKPVASEEAFEQKWTLSGASGSVSINPADHVTGKSRLRKGDLNGPVTLHLVRSVKGTADPSPRITNLDASADHVTFDFTAATRTITASGHVVLTSDNGVFKSTLNADRAVITVDENLNVKQIDTSGEPTTTRLHRLGGVR